MASAVALKAKEPVRMLLSGYPGTAKTGALAALANAGFKLRVLDFDGNPQSLLQYTEPDCLKNIDIITLEDKMGLAGAVAGTKGLPTAFTSAWKLLDEWKYMENGTEVSLGSSKDWGLDTVVVMDGLTGHTEASLRSAMSIMGKTTQTMSQPCWGLAIKQQLAFIQRLMAVENRHNTIVISHLKMVGPKEIESGDGELERDLKQRASKMIPTRLYPTAVGWDLPQKIAGEFPAHVLAEVRIVGKTAKRVLNYLPRTDVDLKLPIKASIGNDLPVETGLLTIFEALGVTAPKGS